MSMPVNLARNLTSPEVNSPGAPLTTEGLAALVRLACRRANLSDKEAAGHMGIDPGQWSRQLSGRQGDHLWFDRLLRLQGVTGFWEEFLPLLAEAFGLCVETQDDDERAFSEALQLALQIGTRLRRRRRA
ncbi:MAG: hypothetical protein AB7G23_02870 [Vicinamibacterales bacterium]